MKKIKLFYLITSLNAGGAELMLKKIIKKIVDSNYEIVLCSLTNTPFLVNELKSIVSRVYILNLENVMNLFQEFLKLRRILKKEKPDILHCFMIHANLLGRFAAIGLDIKVISSIRVKLINRKLLNFIDVLSQKLVDYYTVNSKSLKSFTIEHGIDRRKIVLIQNGVDFNEMELRGNSEDLLNELNLKDSIILTVVANYRKQKDYPTIIKSLNYLKDYKNLVLLSCGTGTIFEDESPTIKLLIRKLKLKNVRLLGYRNDIPDILGITDIWVSSTLFEGQSNSLLEAMAMKKPIITTNISENCEVVRHKKEALLVPIKSPRKMANAIMTLIENKQFAENIANNAYIRVYQNFNINKIIIKLLKFYDLLMKR